MATMTMKTMAAARLLAMFSACPAIAMAGSCHVDGPRTARVVQAGAAMQPPLYLERCEFVVRSGPVDVCLPDADGRTRCIAFPNGATVDDKRLQAAPADDNPTLATFARLLSGDLSVRHLVGRGDAGADNACKDDAVRLPSGLLSLRAQALPWRLADGAAKSLRIGSPGDASPVTIVPEAGHALEGLHVPDGTLQPGHRYAVRLELADGCVSQGTFRVIQRDEQQAIDTEFDAIARRSELQPRSRDLLRASLFDAAGLAFERDLWLWQAASEARP